MLVCISTNRRESNLQSLSNWGATQEGTPLERTESPSRGVSSVNFPVIVLRNWHRYAHLTNTRSLALVGDPEMMAYEILFSFSSPMEKTRFLDLIRSNNELGNEYVDNDLIQPVKDEIRDARPLAAVLHKTALTRALLVATSISSSGPQHRS